MDYFTIHVNESIRLLQSGAVDWIEFYPGLFCREEAGTGWNEQSVCPARQRQECIENTKAMRPMVADKSMQLSARLH
jgi:hypothetical protein